MTPADPIMLLEGRHVVAVVDGQKIRGRLVSARNDFLTIEPPRGPRMIVNRFEVSTISEDTRPASRSPRLTRTFWR